MASKRRKLTEKEKRQIWSISPDLEKNLKNLQGLTHKKSSLVERSFYVINSLFLIAVLGFLVNSMLVKSIPKQKVFQSLDNPIRNGASLNVLKDIFSNSLIYETQFLARKDRNYLRSNPIEFEAVLKDMLGQAYQMEKIDGKIIQRLTTLIAEQKQTAPFQSLERQQAYLFNNVRLKSESYENISADMDKIAEELHGKNQLVIKYLSDSNLSFWLSLVALVFSVAIGIFQIYQTETAKKDQKTVSNTIISLLKQEETSEADVIE